LKDLVEKIRSSVSAQAAVVVTLPIVIILSLQSYIEYREDRDHLFGYTEMQLLRVAEGLKGPAETFAEKKDRKGLQHLVDESARGADIELITIYDPRGLVAASNKKKWVGKPMLAMHPEDITEADIAAIRKGFGGGYSAYYDPDDMQYCLVAPVDYASAGTAALHISLDLSSLAADINKSAVRISLGSVFVASLIGITIYFFLHSLITLRIRNVSAAAVRLAAGEMKARSVVKGTDEIGSLATSFNLLAEEITNWRDNLEEMVTCRVKDLSALYEVAYAISQSLELKTVLPKVLDRVLETVGERKGIVVLVGGEGDTLKLIGHRGLSAEAIQQISHMKVGDGCAGDVILRNTAIRATDNEELRKKMPGLEQEGIRSVLAVPISSRGTAFGAIAVYSDRKDRFSEQDEELLATIGSQVGVAVENARLYEKTLELAHEDALTGLANRRRLMEVLSKEVARASRYNTPLSLLMIDLDRFKQFNDTYGHLKGDELLKKFAELLEKRIRTTDMAGRYGGEEFCLVLPNTPLKGAVVIAERIRKAVEDLKINVENNASPAGATVSIGVAEFAQGETDENLISAADAALYRAKQGGRNKVTW
jgi:diguanylate cyclase (GGDEF)-like protein